MTKEEVLYCSFTNRKKSHHDVGINFSKYACGETTLQNTLSLINSDQELNSIYIHIPYCKKLCSFCSMRRSIKPISEDYYKLIIKQIEEYGRTSYVKSSKINSIYFGGGTPTVLPKKQLELILQALYKNFDINNDAEISMETTISEIDDEKLHSLLINGLNRLSIGVQTFDDDGRKTLGRIGSSDYAEMMIKKIFDIGFKNVNIDIIYNYPHQTATILKNDLQKAFALNIAGFSFYSLIVMNSSKIGRNTDSEEFNKSTLETDVEFFITIINEARKAGYDFLEITKLVKDNRDKYQYIRNSHRGGNIFPIGAGGFIHNTAFMNPLENEKFQNVACNFENLKGISVMNEYKNIKKFSGQLQEGIIDLSLLTDESIENIASILEQLQNENLAEKEKTTEKFKFTDKGFFWGNTIASELSTLAFNK